MPCWTRSRVRVSSVSTCRRRRIACGRRFKKLRRSEEATMYAFEYQRPKTLADAAKALASSGGKPLAGGQSLVAAMKLRLAQPGTLVDLCDISELTGIRKEGDAIVIGAMTGAAPAVFRATPLEAALAKSFTADAAKAVKIDAKGLNTDLHGSAAYRAHLVSVMAGRAVAAAG